ncbi:MAG: MBL fold metallo-hydrolase [Sinobacterium sp.]|nr:MBL fold metallo-hydrolase [Sinobacterium sp.]
MEFCCLGSGSKGNATLIKFGESLVMVDNGFSTKYIEACFLERGLSFDDLLCVLVTHEHADHVTGVGSLSRRYSIPVYATKGSFRSPKLSKLFQTHEVCCDTIFTIECSKTAKTLSIKPVAVPHDSFQSSQFVFDDGECRLGILTDLGSVSDHVAEQYDGLDALLLESNHDVQLLRDGAYPPSLKARVEGNWGHLSNEQAVDFLDKADKAQLHTLVLGHISEKNNNIKLVEQLFNRFSQNIENIIYASQSSGFEWLNVSRNK